MFKVPIEEEITTSKFDKSRNVIVVDETPDEWRLWRAFTRVFTRHNDLALKIYAVLLENKKNIDARGIVTVVHIPRYNVDNALGDLRELGLVSHGLNQIPRVNVIVHTSMYV